jgi:hypothetical protein
MAVHRRPACRLFPSKVSALEVPFILSILCAPHPRLKPSQHPNPRSTEPATMAKRRSRPSSNSGRPPCQSRRWARPWGPLDLLFFPPHSIEPLGARIAGEGSHPRRPCICSELEEALGCFAFKPLWFSEISIDIFMCLGNLPLNPLKRFPFHS